MPYNAVVMSLLQVLNIDNYLISYSNSRDVVVGCLETGG